MPVPVNIIGVKKIVSGAQIAPVIRIGLRIPRGIRKRPRGHAVVIHVMRQPHIVVRRDIMARPQTVRPVARVARRPGAYMERLRPGQRL